MNVPIDATQHPAFLAGGGEMGERMRAHDWASTPLGAPDTWPLGLRTLVGIMLGSRQPMFTSWGPERIMLYNDGYAVLCGGRHPQALGQRFEHVWFDIMDDVGPILDRAYAGEAAQMDDIQLTVYRDGYPEEAHFAFSYTPVRDEAGQVAGMFCPCTEITERGLADRRAAFHSALDERLRDLTDPRDVMAAAAEMLGRHLGVGRVGYGEIDLAGEHVSIDRDWTDGAMPSLAGRLRLEDFGTARIAAFKAGSAVRIDDVRTSALTPGESVAIAYEEIGMRAGLTLPLIEDGRFVAVIYANSAQPRRWSNADEAVVREVAERTWSAVQRARAEKALRGSEAELRRVSAQQIATLEQLVEGVIVTDAAGRITFVNEAAIRLHGVGRLDVAPEEYSGTYHLFTEAGQPYPSEDLPLARAVRGETVLDARWRIRRPDGAEVLALGNARPVVDETGVQIGAVLTLRDETAREAAEAGLRESEARFRTFSQAVPNHVWTAPADGKLDWFNDKVYQYSGAARGELDGDQWTKLVHPDDLPEAGQAWARALANGATYEAEFRIRRADGADRWHIVRALPIHDAEGRATRWVGTNTDIHDQKTTAAELARLNATLESRVEERTRELRDAEEALRQAQKMEAIGQLTGGIAHDFNNLLTGIIGSLELLERRVAVGRTDNLERYTTIASASARRAASLTQRLLAFSRRQALDPKPVSLNRLIASMEDLIRRTVGERVRVETVLAGGLWPTKCDLNQMESALLNLCINARDAMPEGGTLTIETANSHLDDAYAARQRDVAPGQYVVMCVTDTGAGMTPEVIAKAFEPFFTTKPIGHGTGLGLSQLYGFIKQSGGHVGIYSEVGKGTTIRVYLPRFFGKLEDEPEKQPAAAPRAEANEVVLVVEDEDTVRLLILDVLDDLGYAAHEAVDSNTALRILNSRERIDLLVTDVGLPGLNGRQLADRARQLRPELKVMFITGYAHNAAVGNGLLEPGMEVVSKPFAIDVLAQKIRAMIKGE